MKKLLAAILLVALCASLFAVFAACRPAVDPNTVIFYHTMGKNLSAVLDKYIAKFNEIYPDITIKSEKVGSYDDVFSKISTDLDSGKEPNLAYCYGDHVASYNLAGAVIELDDYINSKETIPAGKYGNAEAVSVGLTAEQIKDLEDGGFYEEGRQFAPKADGSTPMYTLPFAKSTEAMYYNKSFFDKNNLSIPTHWWCDENCPENCTTSMDYVCSKIRKIDSNIVPFGYDSDANFFITLCEQYKTILDGNPELYTSVNGEYLFDNQYTKAFVKKLIEWRNKRYFTTSGIFGTYTSDLFKNQGIAMCIGSTGGASYQSPEQINGQYAFEFGVANIPQMNSNDPKVISQGPNICLFKKSDEQDMKTWLFVKYLLTNAQFQAEFSYVSGYVPVIKSALEVPVYKDFLDSADSATNIVASIVKLGLTQANMTFTSPSFPGSANSRKMLDTLMVRLLAETPSAATLDKEIDDAFAAAIKKCKDNG